MKTSFLITITIGLIVSGMATATEPSTKNDTEKPQGQFQGPKTHSGNPTATRGSGLDSCMLINMADFYKSRLKKFGVTDFSSDSLIGLMDSERSTVRRHAASLLGERKERSAISKLEERLDDKSISVMIAISRALWKMDNRKGIKKLEKFCEKASKEINEGKYKKLADHSLALRLLADAGESSAIPYLRELLKHEPWSIRLAAVRSFEKLYEKNPTVLTDIASMLEDDHPQVREQAFKFLRKIKKKATTRKVLGEKGESGEHYTYQEMTDKVIQILDKESMKESLKRLTESHLYGFPGILAISDSAEGGLRDAIHIIGNRRFLKILHELSLLPKSEAGNILNKEIEDTLKKYNTAFDKYLKENLEKFEHNRNTQRIKDKKLFMFVMYDPIAKGPILIGLRYKVLALALIAGNLNLDSTRSSIDKILQTAIDQKDLFSTEELFTKTTGLLMTERTSLYSRRILGTAVLGAFVNNDKERRQVLKSLNLRLQTKKMTPYNSKVTPLDSSHTRGVTPIDFSKGELLVRYFGELTDLSFDALIKTLNDKTSEIK